MKLAVKEIAVDTAILSRDIGRLESLLTRLESGRRKMTQEIQELNTMCPPIRHSTYSFRQTAAVWKICVRQSGK